MFETTNIFNTLLVIPILNALVALYKLFLFIRIPGALGFALILLTVIIRLLLNPFTKAQLESAAKLNKLKPKLDELQKIYKGDKTRIQQEQMKLYQQAGINPAAGCLPLLIQMPILIALYNLFFSILNTPDIGKVVAAVNKVVYTPLLKIESFDLSFFGMQLAHKPNEWQKYGWWLLAIPVITGLLQYVQTKMMMPASANLPADNAGTSQGKQAASQELTVKDAPKEEKKEDDMGTAMQKQMGIMMPLMIGFFAYSFPLGLSLYWNTFTIFGIIQQYQVNKKTKS
jgi:YidC/Oxa1 family membrane protein insertase